MPANPALLPGPVPDHYRVMDLAGEGGRARVFKAWDTRVQRPVALKCPRRPEPRDVDRLRHEASVMSRLRHPLFPAFHAMEVVGGVPLLVTEYVEGRTADGDLNRGGIWSPGRVIAFLSDILDGLEHLHGTGLVHGDIKLKNILVEPRGRVRLVDLGHATSSVSPRPGCRATPPYEAPEIARGNPARVQSDLYSLAVSAHRLLSGHYPSRPGGPVDLPPSTPPHLKAALQRWLDEEPVCRPASARESLLALRSAPGRPPPLLE